VAHHSNHPHHSSPAPNKQIHKDWRVWIAVVLMLAAMAAYILSIDESVIPEGPPQNAAEQGVEVE
jgi:hypothetical protein